MLRKLLLLTALLLPDCRLPAAAAQQQQRPRLAVLTDIGGDPDDQQSLIRLMLYTNELDVRLLIASAAGTVGELKEAATRP
ncbi:MAG: nucleoside hydrolase-like domain-containing protein, partial [Planctomycetaceae bacterium]